MASNGGRRGPVAAAAATTVLLLAGLVTGLLGLRGHEGPPQPSPPSSTGPSSTAPAPQPVPSTGRDGTAAPVEGPSDGVDLGPVLPASRPVRLVIPSIHVATQELLDLG